jgi:hypothetical protein
MTTFTSRFFRVALGLSLAAIAADRAAAQSYPGGMPGATGGGTSGGTYTAPKGGYSSNGAAIGAGVGAAAGAGILFYALHRHHAGMTACVQPAEDGLRIVDEKKNASYALQPGDVYLKAGQRVQVQGKKSKNAAGVETFAATKLVKDLGTCGSPAAPATTAQAQPSGN